MNPYKKGFGNNAYFNSLFSSMVLQKIFLNCLLACFLLNSNSAVKVMVPNVQPPYFLYNSCCPVACCKARIFLAQKGFNSM